MARAWLARRLSRLALSASPTGPPFASGADAEELKEIFPGTTTHMPSIACTGIALLLSFSNLEAAWRESAAVNAYRCRNGERHVIICALSATVKEPGERGQLDW
jgi:hypothetical protein